jgi:TonB-linked SusC/RagA family outer membrane protein
MKKFLMLCLITVFIGTYAFAQTHIVSGKVIDQNGNPVIGASVLVKGSSHGTTADANGNFKITVNKGDVLQVSATNFTKSETTVGSQHEITVMLKAKSNILQEVVVTALGQTTQKAKLGYSTATFSSEAINRNANVNALDALSGKIAGAEISNTGGPGSSTKVILRGYGVIAGGSNQPLYVVDGVPLTDSRQGSSSVGLTTQNDFGNSAGDINPNDIASITVLKGTAASSLYGSAARNGAIMITTKRGRAGKLHVDFAGSANFSKVGKLPIMQDEFGQGWNATFIPGENGSWGPRLDGNDRLWGAVVDNSQLIKPFSFVKDNIRDFYTTGMELNNNIAISGGSDKSTFYFSYGNVESDGVIPSNVDYLGRNTLSLRTNNKFGKFSFNSFFNYINKLVRQPATGQGSSSGSTIFQDLLQIPVDIPIHDLRDYTNKFFDVNSYFTPYAENPYYGIHENGNSQNSDRFFGSLDMQYQFTNSFAAQLRVGGDVRNARGFGYNAVNAAAPGSWNAGGNTEGASKTPDVGSVTETNNYFGNINGDFILKYNKNINNFSIDALAGANYSQADAKSVFSGITDLLVPGFYNLSNSTKPPITSDSKSRQRLFGLYASATLGYKDQLYVTLNARNDWSSTLPIDNDHFFYPGANLSWLVSRTFNLGMSPISYLKFRAGYGQTGNSPQPYLIYPSLIAGSVPIPFSSVDFPFNGISSFEISNSIANANLKPIITTEAELGAEIRFLNDRIGLDVAVYDKKTNGQIFNVPIAPSSGYSSLVQNLGLVTNKGVEIGLNLKPIETKNFSWNLDYNFAKNVNKVDHLTSGLQKVTIFGISNGVELDAVPGQSVSGIYAFGPQRTPDGKIIVSEVTGMPLPTTNRIFYGNAENDFSMGLSNNLRFKEWSLNFSLDYRKGGVFYSKTAEQLLFVGNGRPTIYNDRRPFILPNSVVQKGVDSNGKPVYAENTTPVTESDFGNFWPENSDPALAFGNDILDRSFLKLRSISLSYSLPHTIASKIKANNLTLSIYARNILIWTPASNFYIDPEASNFGNDLSSQLGEFETAPTSMQFGVAVKASF